MPHVAGFWKNTLMLDAQNRSKRSSTTEPQPQGNLKIVILGLSITSSWGNGHAITYRGLMAELIRRGHDVLFLERDASWYADNRDMPTTRYGRVELYADAYELQKLYSNEIRS